MAKTLIVRYKKLGDAILVLPVVYGLALKYPNDKFTVLSNFKFEPLFEVMPDNVDFIPRVTKKRNQTFIDMLIYVLKKQTLLLKLRSMRFDKVAILQKGSFERSIYKILKALGANIEIVRYEGPDFDAHLRLSSKCNDGLTILGIHKDKLKLLGYDDIHPKFDPSSFKLKDISSLYNELGIDKSKVVLAIAPFTSVESKMYPLESMEQVISHFYRRSDQYEILILGGGVNEKQIVDEWKLKYPSIINLIDRLSFTQEIFIIAQSNLVLTMDSANLHLASLLNTDVVSVWGTTTPNCGYYPEKESRQNTIVKGLDCQPCSLWGDNDCSRVSDSKYICIDIEPQIVINKIESVLLENNLK